jgi:histidine phosphotransferase ChpT
VTDTDLAALIGSRICHDLISPIGAINNGLELLSLGGATPGPEMNLIGESVGNASARIRFLRIAFGASGDQMMGAAEILSILRELYEGSRLTLHWDSEDPQPRSSVRLAFLAILCTESAMPFGGTVRVAERDGAWSVEGTADRIYEDPKLWGALERRSDSELMPAHVQFILLPLCAAQEGRTPGYEIGESYVTVTF